MAMKRVRGGPRKKAKAAKITAQLTPPEEKTQIAAKQNSGNGGAIVIDAAALKIPKGFEGGDDSRRFRPDPAVAVIFFVSLAFILFIAYLISIGPEK